MSDRAITQQFFDTWTPEMAYVLGFFAADGCMYRNPRGSYYIGFTSTDPELIILVKKLMQVSNAIETRHRHPRHKISYTVQIGSRTLFERLEGLGFTTRKSQTLRLPEVPSEVLGDFVRGYFDGDGNVYYGQKNLTARFISGSRAFLSSLQKKLSQEGIVGLGSLYAHGPGAYILVYSTGNARQLYSFMYPSSAVPCLQRKRQVFQQAWSLMGS